MSLWASCWIFGQGLHQVGQGLHVLFVSILEVRSTTTAVSDNAMLLMMLQADRTADDFVVADIEDSDLLRNQALSLIFRLVESNDTDMRFVPAEISEHSEVVTKRD